MRYGPVVALQLLAMAGLAAQDSSFILSTTDPAYHTPGFLGNGALFDSLVPGTYQGYLRAPFDVIVEGDSVSIRPK